MRCLRSSNWGVGTRPVLDMVWGGWGEQLRDVSMCCTNGCLVLSNAFNFHHCSSMFMYLNQCYCLPSGKHAKKLWKRLEKHHFQWVNPLWMAIFNNSYVIVYQRVYVLTFLWSPRRMRNCLHALRRGNWLSSQGGWVGMGTQISWD